MTMFIKYGAPVAFALAAAVEGTAEPAGLVNPFEREGRWYKANLHTHTTASDGSVELKDRVAEYRHAGYDILAITDHETTSDLSGLGGDDFLLISGMEIHPKTADGRLYHMVALDVPHGFAFSDDAPLDERLAALEDLGAPYIIAHPYWSGFNVHDLRPLKGAIGVEVYNEVCAGAGRAESSVHWDDLLQEGRMLPGVAVDDVHGRASFGGWVMMKLPELTKEAVLAGLRSGSFYATCGPVIEDCRASDGVLRVRCSPARKLRFLAGASRGRVVERPEDGELTEAAFELKDDMPYVRVEVVGEDGRKAWTNPLIP